MARKRPLKYRDLRSRLESFGVFENKRRGKGSERMFSGVVDGVIRSYPTKCHNENDEKPVPVINAIRRCFHLTPEYWVSDEDFYGK